PWGAAAKSPDGDRRLRARSVGRQRLTFDLLGGLQGQVTKAGNSSSCYCPDEEDASKTTAHDLSRLTHFCFHPGRAARAGSIIRGGPGMVVLRIPRGGWAHGSALGALAAVVRVDQQAIGRGGVLHLPRPRRVRRPCQPDCPAHSPEC